MATSYTQFGRFIKITGANLSAYNEKKAENTGNIIFADLTVDGENKKYICANGIEYEIKNNDANFEDIYDRLDTLDASVLDISTYLDALQLNVVNNKISITGVDGTIEFVGKDYVNVTTNNSSIEFSIDGSVIHGEGEATSTDANANKLTTKKYVDDAIANSGANVESTISVLENSTDALIHTTTSNNAGDTVSESSVIIKTDEYAAMETATATNATAVKLSINVADSSDAIDEASETDSSLATSYAVKTYVESKLGNIANAVTLEGGFTEFTTALDATNLTEVNVGDQYIVDTAEKTTFTLNDITYTVEPGDSIFVTGVTDGKIASVTIVEKNLDGAVTATEELENDYVVLGGGSQNVKTTLYTLGADTSAPITNATADTSVLVTAYGVKEYVDSKIADVDITIDSSTPEYVEVYANGTDVTIGANVVLLEDAISEETSGLADAYDVSLAIQNALQTVSYDIRWTGGDSDNSVKLQTNDASIGLQVIVENAVTNTEVGSSDYLEIAVDSEKLTKLTLKTATLADASNGTDGIATAMDVYEELTRVEEVVAHAVSEVADKVGLEEDFQINWEGSFEETDSVIDAIKKLKNGEFDAGSLTVNGKKYVDNAINIGFDTTKSPYLTIGQNTETADGTVTFDASIEYAAKQTMPEGLDNATDTGIATDGYVKDAIMNAMAWEVIS